MIVHFCDMCGSAMGPEHILHVKSIDLKNKQGDLLGRFDLSLVYNQSGTDICKQCIAEKLKGVLENGSKRPEN